MTPGGGPPTLSCTPKIQGTLYAFFGENDASIPLEQVDQIEAALQASGICHRVFRYPADHGFFCDQRQNYDASAARAAWPEVLRLFRENLS
jgi:carboxymethylenebutenolidase